MKNIALILGLVALSGCASIVEGHTQQILVNTSPADASCAFVRNNEPIGVVTPTPNSIVIEKTKHDIIIKCDKPGYEQATFFNKSDVDGWVFGNIVLGGLIGWGIDSATGADNKYESPVNLSLSKK